MIDPFKSYAPSLTDPVQKGQNVTPDDAADLDFATRAVFVSGDGSLRVTLLSGEVVSFAAIGRGWHPMRITRVWQTGTTATGIVACA